MIVGSGVAFVIDVVCVIFMESPITDCVKFEIPIIFTNVVASSSFDAELNPAAL